MLFAVGLDPDVATVFVQSHVPEHSQLGWIMECTVSFGELQPDDAVQGEVGQARGDFISAGLFTYPALQAADILLYDADEVPGRRRPAPARRDHPRHRDPVQRPLRRDVRRPEGGRSRKAGARVMDLQDPTSKMSKSADSDAGLDRPARRPERRSMKKFKRAVTDSESEVRYDREAKPGVVEPARDPRRRHRRRHPRRSPSGYTQYGPLKADTGEAVVELLRPIQARYRELMTDRGELAALLRKGAARPVRWHR